MAPETHQQNGVQDGETASTTAPSAPLDPEPRSPALDPAESADRHPRGQLSGMQHHQRCPIPPLQPSRETLHACLSGGADDSAAPNTDDAGASDGLRPTPLQGMRDDSSPPQGVGEEEKETQHPTQQGIKEAEEEDSIQSDNISKTLFSDADEGSTHLTQDNNDHASDNDVAELSEGTKDKDAQKEKNEEIKNPVSDLSKDGAGERPVRQKLKETSIAAGAARAKSPHDHAMASQAAFSADSPSDMSSVDGRGRLRRKRSLEDVNQDDGEGASGGREAEESGHRRKRSRDSKPEDDGDKQELSKSKLTVGGEHGFADADIYIYDEGGLRTPTEELKSADRDAASKILSPKKKRSRDQFDKDLKSNDVDEKAEEGVSVKDGESLDKPAGNRTVEGEPEKKRHRDNSQDRSSQGAPDPTSKKISPPNPFANTSAISPFAAISPKPIEPTSNPQSEKKEHVTSASAFASSGLAAFAGSEKSPFGALGASTSPFKPAASTTEAKSETAPSSSAFATSPFAAAAASSPFTSLGGGSGFGGSAFGSGFAAAAPLPGGGLKSFAAPVGDSAVLGSASKSKVLGAGSVHEEEEEEGGDDEDPSKQFEGLEEEKGDERFHERETETGEEGEVNLFSCRGKLFHFDGKEWKERGVGVFKVNVREPQDDSEERDVEEGKSKDEGAEKAPKKKTARLIMRADGVWRVILNIPMYKGMKAGDPSGAPPPGKQVHFAGFEEGKRVPFLIRTGNDDVAKELYITIREIQERL
ncbi:hypothetical protein AJ79_06430 [Helicocarpus griseus UAMH5409]|uniref:RanBD1 domain-containing protein n=1 Tax=Helicocarpus griseus UAMH5409 TaxID=1447875 RepID=A0A2B7XCZ5_9EURO|nr:hypothetical protein AJ79_06430 [Helicocarpus griseus UAMH5409]